MNNFQIGEIYQMIDRNDVVSFDVFDTVLLRIVKNPEDLFDLIRNKDDKSYAKIRMLAQSNISEKKTFYNLDDIYQMPLINKFDSQVEIGLEHHLTFENIYLKPVYEYAKLHNKTVILVSDMYLPENIIKSILAKNVPWLQYS